MRVSTDIVSDEELRGLFIQADVDGEGSLDATEFAQWIAAQPAATDDPRMSEVKEVVHSQLHAADEERLEPPFR